MLAIFEYRPHRITVMAARPGNVLKLAVDVAAKSTISADP
jgi:hypothetical protein